MNPLSGGFDISSITRQSPAAIPGSTAGTPFMTGHHHNPLLQTHHQHHNPHLNHAPHQPHHQQMMMTGHGGLHPSNTPLGMAVNPIHGGHPSHLTSHMTGHHSTGPHHPMAHHAQMASHLMGQAGAGLHQHATVTHIPTPHHMQSSLSIQSAMASSHAGLPASGIGHQSSHHLSSGHHPVTHLPHQSHGQHSLQPTPVHQQIHQPIPQHQQPPMIQPPVATTPAPVMSDANNKLAFSVNLSSIQSLVDVLVELPVPVEGPESEFKRSPLIHDQSILTHISNSVSSSVDSQNTISTILGPSMAAAKELINSLNLNFLDPSASLSIIDPTGGATSNNAADLGSDNASNRRGSSSSVNNGNSNIESGTKFSQIQVQNSYLLSLFESSDCFSNSDISLPQAPATARHTRSQQQQQSQHYWNPWSEQQQQPQAHSPYVASPSAATNSRQATAPFNNNQLNQNSTSVQQTMYSNHDSNSNTSGSIPDHPATPIGVTGMSPAAHQYQAQNRYHQQAPPSHPSPQQQMANFHQQAQIPDVNQQQYLMNQDCDSIDVKQLNAYEKEPMIVLDKLDVDQALLDYYNSTNGPSEEQKSTSLADRIKSNKRQRVPETSPVQKRAKKSNRSASYNEEEEDENSYEPEMKHTPVKSQSLAKSSSAHRKHQSPAKVSTKTTHSYISSSYLSSTSSSAPQLESQSSNLPTQEKFEAMLDELFDPSKVSMPSGNKKESETEDEDSEDERKKKKKKLKQMNGDSAPAIFDINLSGSTLNTFVALTAKLKRNNQTSSTPATKITNLLTVLTQQLAIQSAGLKDKRRRSSVEEQAANSDDDEDETNITNSTSMMHKFEACCDCCLVALNILSSKGKYNELFQSAHYIFTGMASRVYLEECIEQVIAFLNTTIQQFTTIGGAISTAASPTKSRKSPKKISNYISPTVGANKKILAKMYTKWSELLGLLVDLLTLRAGSMTDTLVLSTTRLALAAFFLENLNPGSSNSFLNASSSSNEIQLNALKLTTTIFSQYSGHRGMILDEILQSIARLPTTKRNRVTYKIDGEDGSGSISMFSALLLQLIQSLFTKRNERQEEDADSAAGDVKKSDKGAKKENIPQILKTQYDVALRIAGTFVNTFLKKCCGIHVGGHTTASDTDYRFLFEGLVTDLMVTLHKPNWPASQLMTQVLVKILITNIQPSGPTKGTKGGTGGASAQLNLKLASLDHLGTICSRFAKELSNIEGLKEDVKNSLNTILNGDENGASDDDKTEDEDGEVKESKKKKQKRRSKRKSTRNDFLTNDEILSREIWKHLIRYFDEETLIEEKNLLVSIWLREMKIEMESAVKSSTDVDGEEDEGDNGAVSLSHQEKLDQKIKHFMSLYRKAANPNLEEDEYVVIDPKTAELIIRFLDISQNTTVKLFDAALGHVIAALSSTSNTMMRSRAMKSLSIVLNHAHRRNATALLARPDLQKAMRCALLDTSTSVREATIDLIGKFMLNGQSEDLIDKYYDLITERVLDTGVSVRKRVIKILREICITYPKYPKVPEVCSKIIKRINDDGEGIRKLVTETFTSMWFKEEKSKESVRLKVACINHVVATVLTDRIGTEWLQQLLTNLFASNADKKKTVTELEEDEDRPAQSAQQLAQVKAASEQIIEVLIGEILCGNSPTDESGREQSGRSVILSAVTTIWLFGKVAPQLLLNHISTLHPYLQIKCTTQLDIMVLSKVVQILELVLPKLSNPSEMLLTRIEEDLTKNILQNNASVLGVCVSCLATVILKHSNNTTLAQDLFKKFFLVLDSLSRNNELMAADPKNRPRLLRALFTCGLFAKHFDFLREKSQLYDIFVRYVYENRATDDFPQAKDSEVLSKALTGLGFMFERNPQFSLKPQTQDLYKSILSESSSKFSVDYQERTQCQVLKNLTNYLSDEFNNEMQNKVEWSKEDLKSMTSEEGDSNSLQSTIIQCYLNDVLRCTLSPILNIRRAAVNLVHIIHNGGHVHPLQLVPYLIAMSSDDDSNIRCRADHVLNEIERKYHGFVSMKSKIGVHLAYQLHSHSARRGYRVENINLSAPPTNATGQNSKQEAQSPEERLVTGRLSTLYSVVTGNRQSRRAFITGLLKYFDVGAGSSATSYNDVMTNVNVNDARDEDPSLIQQFVCDNIVWLPYCVWDEPLYILTQLELNLSLLASFAQSQFKEALGLTDDDDDELENEESKREKLLKQENNPQMQGEDVLGVSLESENNGIAQNHISNPDVAKQGFNSDLSSYLPKLMPPLTVVTELVKTLKAYYMLFWSKHLLRELFSINDVKIQDYSPNENQKVWDKPVHRRAVDVKTLEKLMAYPAVTINVENYDESLRDHVLDEYSRFKSLQATGNEMSSKAVMQLMKEQPGSKMQNNTNNQFQALDSNFYSNYMYEQAPAPSVDVGSMPDISNEFAAQLIQQIRQQEGGPSIALQDISSMDIKRLMDAPQASNPSLKMTISAGQIKRPKKKKKDKKKKKKKHHKKYDSDSEEDDSPPSDASEDESDDPDYD